jgi:dienelactone hydrolase
MATSKRVVFELAGADGGPLRGECRLAGAGEDRPAVVICHGFKGFKDWGFFPPLATRLANAGFAAVSFNFSGSGVGPEGDRFSEPERFGHATFTGDVYDLAIVCDALAAGRLAPGVAPPKRIGVFGHSRGGGVAVLYAARAQIAALVTWAAISRVRRWDAATIERWRRDGRLDVVNARTGEVLPLFAELREDIEANENGSLDIEAAAGRVTAPWLIVHGDSDETVSVEEARRLAGRRTGETTRLEIVAGGDHTFGTRHPWSGSTPELENVLTETVAWFGRYLF